MIAQLLTPTHLAILLAVLLLLFRPGRLPQTGRAVGRTLREFREGIAGQDAVTNIKRAVPPPAAAHGQDAARAEAATNDRHE